MKLRTIRKYEGNRITEPPRTAIPEMRPTQNIPITTISCVETLQGGTFRHRRRAFNVQQQNYCAAKGAASLLTDYTEASCLRTGGGPFVRDTMS
ncbi:hypothetical protein AVEN_115042-1 [Araneus ventricosus]|uniref:Uncharacterized protein n=1 Tax=Araneus ventricosus TaxID=182803 RepID=A0A4Y1ZX89_ARAVE|nr:hypothetical protein AVEN_115042-1 [Araneus ventricosus]